MVLFGFHCSIASVTIPSTNNLPLNYRYRCVMVTKEFGVWTNNANSER